MHRIALALGLALAAARQTPLPQRLAWVPNPRTTDGTWVSDPAGHLAPATRAALNAAIGALEAANGTEIAVVIIDSTGGLTAFDAALALHRGWGVGKRGRDNGIVFLWVPAEREVFISVGTGLEGVLPDRRVGRIRDERLFPAFRAGRFDEGVQAAVAALADAAREETAWREGPAAAPQGGGGGGIGVLGWLGLGAGGIAGTLGGAVGVRRWRRRRPRQCANGHPMRLLDEAADDDYLDQGAKSEERVHSVDWDVWLCDTCGEVLRIPYRRLLSGYGECPSCRTRTLTTTTTTLQAATTSHGGRVRVRSHCKHCGFATSKEQSTPRLRSSSSSGSSHSRPGGGGGGGGSSFGGGSARGGGAGGRY
jgi:uncharacterized protein